MTLEKLLFRLGLAVGIYGLFCASIFSAIGVFGVPGTVGIIQPILLPPPVARELGETRLMLLAHPGLTAGAIERTCAALTHAMRQAAA